MTWCMDKRPTPATTLSTVPTGGVIKPIAPLSTNIKPKYTGSMPAFTAMGNITGAKIKIVDGQENPYNTILSSKFYEVQKYLSVTNHVYSPWIVTVSKKWWDGLSKTEQKILLDAARVSRDFERKDTRDEAAKALGDLKAKGMQVNELPV